MRLHPIASLVSILLLFLTVPQTSVQAEEKGPCGAIVCFQTGDRPILAGDVEDVPGGDKIALNEPDPLYWWRLMNTCADDEPLQNGCAVLPPCPAPPDRTVRWFLVQYQVIADGEDSPWISDGEHCVDITDLEPVVTPAMVQAEFEELPLPLGEISLQPAGAPVLVNLGAIFYTTQAEQQPYDIEIIGQAVHIDAFIIDYSWNVGDGSAALHGRGGPYP
ncbi:MAG: hypothetical protein ACR2JG_09125, partial [Geodermatophilaceae bacterium]